MKCKNCKNKIDGRKKDIFCSGCREIHNRIDRQEQIRLKAREDADREEIKKFFHKIFTKDDAKKYVLEANFNATQMFVKVACWNALSCDHYNWKLSENGDPVSLSGLVKFAEGKETGIIGGRAVVLFHLERAIERVVNEMRNFLYVKDQKGEDDGKEIT